MIRHNAQSVLKTRFISYATPLALARRWSQSGDPPERKEALVLLEGLFTRFPHSIEIGQQLALSQIEAGKESEAMGVLAKLQLLCRNKNEEVLSRCGRVYRDRGDHFVAYPVYHGPPEITIGGPKDEPVEARRCYLLALQEYNEAYKVRGGHYPGVNVATLHLIIAALEANDAAKASSLEKSKDLAQKLLKNKAAWPHELADDPVWHAASEGEIYLLLREWQKAYDCYRTAQAHKECKPFHRTSMLKQVIRIVYCYERLGVESLGAFDDLTTVFPPGP